MIMVRASDLTRIRFCGIPLLGMILTVVASAGGHAETTEIRGNVQIIDGDTVKMGERIIHLFGVDAPEIKQQCRIYRLNWPCGERAVVTLELFIAKKPVRCEIVRKSGGTADLLLQGHCYNFENVNLNSAIIGAGMALPLLRQTRRYEVAGNYAQIKRLGLWSGRFILPEDWREGKRFRPIGQPFRRRTLKD